MKTEDQIREMMQAFSLLVDAWVEDTIPSVHDALLEMGHQPPDTEEESVIMVISAWRTLEWVLK